MYFGWSTCWIAPLTPGSASSDCPAASSKPATATIRAQRLVIEFRNHALILSHMVSASLCREEMNDERGGQRGRGGNCENDQRRQAGLIRRRGRDPGAASLGWCC